MESWCRLKKNTVSIGESNQMAESMWKWLCAIWDGGISYEWMSSEQFTGNPVV